MKRAAQHDVMFSETRMRNSVFIASLALVTALPAAAQGPEVMSKEEAYVLVDNLLQLTDESKDIRQSLSKNKEWEAQYIKARESAHLGSKQLTVYFFVVFVAEARAMAHTTEEISHEIVPLYVRDKVRFLSVLNNNPALVSAICRSLGSHFTIEGKKKDFRSFVTKNSPLIEKHLYKPYAETCIAELEKWRT